MSESMSAAVICRARALFNAYETAPLEVAQLFDEMRQEKEAQTLRAVKRITEAFKKTDEIDALSVTIERVLSER